MTRRAPRRARPRSAQAAPIALACVATLVAVATTACVSPSTSTPRDAGALATDAGHGDAGPADGGCLLVYGERPGPCVGDAGTCDELMQSFSQAKARIAARHSGPCGDDHDCIVAGRQDGCSDGAFFYGDCGYAVASAEACAFHQAVHLQLAETCGMCRPAEPCGSTPSCPTIRAVCVDDACALAFD